MWLLNTKKILIITIDILCCNIINIYYSLMHIILIFPLLEITEKIHIDRYDSSINTIKSQSALYYSFDFCVSP